ncbi:MAG: UDP-3-O-(3-hydroxymyristoyl)glucosamine N-acyltransferase [Alphaproteobacteria bacterium]|nr:UDP-3-O-(3-hydroxymyristoyl)glucosamine N-acyltransferase [Alphaproteobacteria bacterium]
MAHVTSTLKKASFVPSSAFKPLTLKSIAQSLGATVMGNGDLVIHRLVHPKDATNETDILLAFDKALHPLLESTPASAAIMANGQDDLAKAFIQNKANEKSGVILVDRPRYAMAKLTALFARPNHTARGIHPSAVVDTTATLGANVAIGPLCYVGPYAEIGNDTTLVSQVTIGAYAKVGKDCLFYAGARIGDYVSVGDRAIFHYNSVIGSDGFSFVTPERGSVEAAKSGTSSTVEAFNNEIIRIHSIGAVVIGDNVEIGSSTTIDRGTITDTRIGSGTKIDNQVQIGHNVEIGENCLICGTAGVAGSTTIGNRVVLAARSGVADHIKVGDDAVLMASSQLGTNLPEKAIYMGFPAMPRERFMEQMIHLARLKNMSKRIGGLEEKVNSLESPLKKS